jgi:NADPH-dependent 2,4-dienoyl-CoA reductase/sulfur reductase-like enzyme
MSEPNHPQLDTHQLRHDYAKKILENYHARIGVSVERPDSHFPMPMEGGQANQPNSDISDTLPIARVAIVGAGVAGLRAAMILGANYDVDVYEASTRIGGRLYTHQFNNTSQIGTEIPGGEYDYFVSKLPLLST